MGRRSAGMPRLNAKALEQRIDDYFRSCYGEPMVDEETGGVKLDKKGKPVASGKRPPTLSGLALAMGFASKADMLRYQGKPEVMTAIQRGRTRVEQYAEEKLFDKESSAGAKFVLEKDFGEAMPEEDEGPGLDIMAEVRSRLAAGPLSGDGGA